jgi:hypothetical protein
MHAPESTVRPRDLLDDLSAAVTTSQQAHVAPEIRRLVGRCLDLGRRDELVRFLERVDGLSAPDRAELAAAMDEIQLRSKLWLIDQLGRHRDLSASCLVVLGAWCGILPLLVNWQLERRPPTMRCIDIDARATELGSRVVGACYTNVEFRRADVMDLDYAALGRDPRTIVVNTICEHLPRFDAWRQRLPDGLLVVLQSNNYFLCPDHVNAVHSLDELKQQARLSTIVFEGSLPLSVMDRYMLIGYC